MFAIRAHLHVRVTFAFIMLVREEVTEMLQRLELLKVGITESKEGAGGTDFPSVFFTPQIAAVA